MDASLDLNSHLLPPGVLPFAPRRPFAPYSPAALAEAVQLTRQWPEKTGILSHVVRSRGGAPMLPAPAMTAVIEAHFDAVAVPPELADRLLELGFEPDGFARFVPAHFATHHTLKFKIGRADTARRRVLRGEAERACAALIHDLATRWSDIEAYLELEIYTSASRRRWADGPIAPGWGKSLPFAPDALARIQPPGTVNEARRQGLSTELAKRADIHLKVAHVIVPPERERLIEALEAIGFYRVLTWAGNDVCTAQFASGADARRCFESFAAFFDVFGGCVELTMEPVARVWRSRSADGVEVRLGALPPLVMSIKTSDAKKQLHRS
jgi:hypothetical protein